MNEPVTKARIKVADINISHPDKVLFPDDAITKADLARYYRRIAGHMQGQITDRPLTLRRYPEGIGEDGFFNKHAPEHFPDFIPRLQVPLRSGEGGSISMVAAQKPADLVYFAGQNVIEVHMAPVREPDGFNIPDQMIFDLDPSDGDFSKLRKVALGLKDMLDDLSMPAFVKTTGSRGVHVHVPLVPRYGFDRVKPVVKKLAERLNEALPDLTTLELRKDRRGEAVFIDWLRNDYAMTVIAPFSPRAISGAPVATPLDWAELKQKHTGPQRWSIRNIFRRLAHKQDPWRDFRRSAIQLPDNL